MKCAAIIIFLSFCFQVLDLVPIDCTKQVDIDKLLTRIKQEVLSKDTFPSIEQTIPRSYYEVEKDIQELKNGGITEHGQYFIMIFFFFNITVFGVFEFLKFALIIGIVSQSTLLNELKNRHDTLDDNRLQLILQYLHRIGVIMWYKEIPELADFLFLEPSFLISLFKVHASNIQTTSIKCP